MHLTNLAFALRNLLRIAEVARDVPGVAEATAQFERAVPGIKDARDVLEHFDEYALGVGKLQERGELGEFFTVVERDGEHAILKIAGRFEIRTKVAFDASNEFGVQLIKPLRAGSPIGAEPSRRR